MLLNGCLFPSLYRPDPLQQALTRKATGWLSARMLTRDAFCSAVAKSFRCVCGGARRLPQTACLVAVSLTSDL